MDKKDSKLIKNVVEKVLEEFDFEVEDMLESEGIEQNVKDKIMESLDETPPEVDWIQLVELDEAEAHKNKNGDFLSN